ncbi:bacteriohemerythrin [Ketobacter sp.]|uniref:bacteriohemerythrin n=1 Tax=Ketobacter sp. TaxID=2083498 RepID=UPI000F1E427E|nr:bacteriohemerythrin [Ketobacter sp.]RLT99244.1 MAG: bacteriohemerythrin [Ketobacter sp.]
MPHFVWSSEFELGIPVIDGQHRRIIDYINRVYDVLEHDPDQARINAVLTDLVDYTFSHLTFEEAMLEEIGYGDFDSHQLAHRTFTKLIETLRQRALQGESVGAELAAFLNNWLITHIMAEDAGYVDAVQAHLAGSEAGRRRYWLHKAVTRYFQ